MYQVPTPIEFNPFFSTSSLNLFGTTMPPLSLSNSSATNVSVNPNPAHVSPTEEDIWNMDEYEDFLVNELRNASASFNSCSLQQVEFFDVSSLPYMGELPPSSFSELSVGDVVKIVVYAFLSLFGVLGNAIVIALVLKNRPLRTTINYYLISLAVSDIIISAFCTWIHLIDNLSRAPWVMGPFVCKISGFLQMTALTSSTMTLTVISADRLLAVKFPLKVRAMQRSCSKAIIGIWVSSIVVSVPFVVYREMVTLKWSNYDEHVCMDTWPRIILYDSNGNCYLDDYWKRIYYTTVSAALFFFPCAVMGVNYSLICASIWNARVPGPSSSPEHPASNYIRRDTKYKVLRMVAVVMVVFCVCWTPLQFINLYAMWAHNIHTDGNLRQWFEVVAFISYCLAYANSTLNPILYGGLNSAFRRSTIQTFSWWATCSKICMASRRRGRRRTPGYRVTFRPANTMGAGAGMAFRPQNNGIPEATQLGRQQSYQMHRLNNHHPRTRYHHLPNNATPQQHHTKCCLNVTRCDGNRRHTSPSPLCAQNPSTPNCCYCCCGNRRSPTQLSEGGFGKLKASSSKTTRFNPAEHTTRGDRKLFLTSLRSKRNGGSCAGLCQRHLSFRNKECAQVAVGCRLKKSHVTVCYTSRRRHGSASDTAVSTRVKRDCYEEKGRFHLQTSGPCCCCHRRE